MDYVRLWHTVPNNPKLRTVAKRSGQGVASVLSVYAHMMVMADQNNPRGTIEDWEDETIALALEISERDVGAIRDAMQGRLLDGNRLIEWRKIRPPVTDDRRPMYYLWKKIRERIFLRDDHTCQYCGARGVALECDHVVPVSAGGSHDDDNLVTACLNCNRSKGNKLLSEWRGF